MPGARASPRSSVGPVIDLHTHPMLEGEPPITDRSHTFDEYRAQMRGIHLVASAVLVMAPAHDLPRTRSLNDRLLALAQGSPDRIWPFCSVHPADGPAALRELRRVASAGARGIKLHPNTQGFDVADPAVTRVVRTAATLGLPVLFDAYSPFDADQPGKFIRLAMEVPEARLILAHAHGPAFPQLLVYEILARYPWWRRNVWIDLSATAPLLADGPFAESFVWVCRKVGIDRIVFGSDYPLDDPPRAIAAVRRLGFRPAELSAIFHDNAARLMDRPAAPDRAVSPPSPGAGVTPRRRRPTRPGEAR